MAAAHRAVGGTAGLQRQNGFAEACDGGQRSEKPAPRRAMRRPSGTAIADRGPIGVAAADLVHLRCETGPPRARKLSARGRMATAHGAFVVGAGRTAYDGWVSTNPPQLDLLHPETWVEFLEGRKVDALLCEHVWHLLTPKQADFAARLCLRHLAENGYLRLAVPDGFHPAPDYIDWVKPGGTGPSTPDHRVLYTYRSLSACMEAAGFAVTLLEYFDESHMFHRRGWNPADGFVRRSALHDPRNTGGQLHYTSVILDARRTEEGRFESGG
jgi:predicted SAM-dependent methyltransferase